MQHQQEQNEAQQHERDALFGPQLRRNFSPPRTNPHRGRSRYNTPIEYPSSRSNGDRDATAASPRDNNNRGRYDPGEPQQLSWAEVRDRIDVDERRRGLRSAHESAETGRATLESLEDQKERLERSEMVLDSTRYAIEQSARVLRGMNFWGKIVNAFTEDTKIPEPYNRSSTATAANWAHDDAPAEGFICPDCRRKFHTADGLVAHFESEHRGRSAASSAEFERHADGDPEFLGRGEGTDDTSSTTVGGSSVASGDLRAQLFSGKDFRRGSPPSEIEVERESDGGGGSRVIAEQRAVMDAQDAYLDGVGRAVTELGFLGRNIGASIARQGDALERVVEKTEGSNDRAAFVTRKAARQAQRAKPKKPIFVMSVALQEVSTGLYMAVTGEDVILRGRELRNVCQFEVWQRQDGIFGFKSSVTGRWLGQTFLGYLRVTGTSFSKNYEWQADLKRKQTTMICCSANWGAGAYLSARPIAGGERTSITPTNANNSTSGTIHPVSASRGNSHTLPRDGVVVTTAELGLVDVTIANKCRAAVFRVIDCQGYAAQPYIGGRLIQIPPTEDGEAARRGGRPGVVGESDVGHGGWGQNS